MKRSDVAALALICAVGLASLHAGAAYARTPDLRGFGRVTVTREILGGGDGQAAPASGEDVVVFRFECETPQNAETVAGKFLMDLHSEDGVSVKDGIHETRGGAAFAVERDGRRTAIYAAESRAALAAQALRMAGAKLVPAAVVPEWMKAFHWGTYGVGGLENFHDWMAVAKRCAGVDPNSDRSILDPRDDFEFLRRMGPMHFDNWLQFESFDNSDGILSPYIYSRGRLAADSGVPFGVRLYMPAGGTSSYTWFSRRFASRMDRPAPWMQNGWLRYHNHLLHASWYDEDIWGYTAARTKDVMRRLDPEGRARTWMHPAGELVHQPWYDWHADYSAAASNSWHRYLRAKGVALEDTAAMFNRPGEAFASWDDVPVPEFAHFAGLSGLILDLRGTWRTAAADRDDWTDLPDFPGNWDFLGLYGGANAAQKVKQTAERRFRRTFTWKKPSAPMRGAHDASRGRTYLYFFPMAQPGGRPPRHEVSLNGGKPVTVGAWCALDVTDALREGENTLDILLRGICWNGRVFLSNEKPAVYPNMPEPRCRLWTLWHCWRRDVKADRCEMVFDAMRQADPNAPIEFMAPMHFGQRVANRLLHDWGAFAQFTGEGVWFFPWYKRYARLYGYQGTSELAGPYSSVAEARRSSLRVFLAGLDMHKPVFLAQTYSRNPAVREWWLSHKGLFARMGTYDIDLKQPQVLIYRRTELTGDPFPEPFPVIDPAVGKIRSPWNYDIGRGELQSIGQSHLYIDDDGIEDGKMYGFKVMFDCGNEIIPEGEVARIRAWVEKGGVFVAYPFTGRSTQLKANAWPMAGLTGAKIKENAVRPGYVPKVAFPADGMFFPSFAGRTIHGAKRRQHEGDFALDVVADDVKPILMWEDGRIAATVRRVGKGLAVHLGSMFWRGSEDVNGMWHPTDEVERVFLKDLLTAVGHGKALVETDDRLVLAQPYRSKNGLGLVAVLCNFNEDSANVAKRETAVILRTERRPKRVVVYAGEGVLGRKGDVGGEAHFEWNEAEGIAALKLPLPPQEVAVVEAECHGAGDALEHWWAESKEQWHEIKKPSRDFSKYCEGEWKDPTQDLKEGWSISAAKGAKTLNGVPLDCLQFWGWPDGMGAMAARRFDLAEAGWLTDGGATRLVVGSWVGHNLLTPATIRFNGAVLAEKANKTYLDFDVTALVKGKGNELELEFADAQAGEKFTGMNGCIYLYHRERPVASVDLLKEEGRTKLLRGEDGKDAIVVHVPKKWRGLYRVRLYMEGARDVPKGVRVRDRFVRKHHHNFGSITDIDITDLLEFGVENRIDIGANSPAEQRDRTSIKPLTVLRLDLFRLQ
jgi:hypothetical protein